MQVCLYCQYSIHPFQNFQPYVDLPWGQLAQNVYDSSLTLLDVCQHTKSPILNQNQIICIMLHFLLSRIRTPSKKLVLNFLGLLLTVYQFSYIAVCTPEFKVFSHFMTFTHCLYTRTVLYQPHTIISDPFLRKFCLVWCGCHVLVDNDMILGSLRYTINMVINMEQMCMEV